MTSTMNAPSLDVGAPGFDVDSDTNAWAFLEVRHGCKWWAFPWPFRVTINGDPIGDVQRNRPLRFRILAGKYKLAANRVGFGRKRFSLT